MFIKIKTKDHGDFYLNILKITDLHQTDREFSGSLMDKKDTIINFGKGACLRTEEALESIMSRIKKEIKEDPTLSRFDILDI